jgi:hypothetical protein
MYNRGLVAAAALSVAMIAPQAAHAAPVQAKVPAPSSLQSAVTLQPAEVEMTTAQYMEILNAAIADGGTVRSDGTMSYTLNDGSELVMAMPQTKGKTGPNELGAGWDGWKGPYISFNRTDQSALLAGGAAALSVAVCAIPGVGWASCAGLVGLVTIAAFYVNEYGRCSTSKPYLRVYLTGRKGCYA